VEQDTPGIQGRNLQMNDILGRQDMRRRKKTDSREGEGKEEN
jgi:hypothetical protein